MAVTFKSEYALVPRLWWRLKGRSLPAHEAIRELVDRYDAWFRLFGPRQCGKTTVLMWSMEDLHNTGRHVCIYWSLQNFTLPEENPSDQNAREVFDLDLLRSLVEVTHECQEEGHLSGDFDAEATAETVAESRFTVGFRFKLFLERLAKFVQEKEKKKLVLFIDEVDTLGTVDNPKWMIHFLDNMRKLHSNVARNRPAPTSVAFCGLYDIGKVVPRASPFNNANEMVTPPFWSEDEFREILQQYADDSGRTVEGGAVREIMRQCGGHPWTCNYIMHKLTDTADDPITVSDVDDAVEEMLLQRVTGVRSLETRIKEDERVRRAVIWLGGGPVCSEEDMDMAAELGVARQNSDKMFEFSSELVREVSFRFMAKQRFEADHVNTNYLRSTFILENRVNWAELFRALHDNYLRSAVAATLRGASRPSKSSRKLKQHMFDFITSNVREEYFTNIASAGLALIINGDFKGSVRTEEKSPQGAKPDHLLQRTLPNGNRTRALVENKLAKPTKAGEAVPQKTIDAKVKEAVKDLAHYYHTYGHDVDALLAVVYAPSAAKADAKQFTVRQLTPEQEQELLGKAGAFAGKPCFVIVFRFDLLTKSE